MNLGWGLGVQVPQFDKVDGRDKPFLRSLTQSIPLVCLGSDEFRLAVGSCANEKLGETNPAWKALLAAKPDALLLLGDTPYIDTTELDVQRRRYREFYSNPDLAALMQVTPTWATWDDHDFAGDGADGTAKGKENARRAFVEYHALASYGERDQGIYTRFQLGAADVFVLDTRWFSGTEPSFADATKPTLLGKQQWEWLTRGLKESTAPFKLLACGMVWNGAVRPNKPDYWMAYPHERQALFDFVAKEKIAGVVLVSGDIHRSRVYAFPPENTGVPYPLHELVTSPLGNHPMDAANVASKDLVFDSGDKHQFLLLDVERERLVARFHAAARGEVHRLELAHDDLRPHAAITPLARTDDGGSARTKVVMARSDVEDARLLFLGASTVERWHESTGAAHWTEHLAPLGAVDLGVGGDRTEHVLWRLDHGQLAGYARRLAPPKLAVVLVGSNNFAATPPSTLEEVAQGLDAIAGRLLRALPTSRVLVLGVFPRADLPDLPVDRIPRANALLRERLARRGERARFLDVGDVFLGSDGAVVKELLPDGLHPSAEGYRRAFARIDPVLSELLHD
ncbi:MAG: alkaline phosphatase D family protein [Planctomycetes bacterium]|nr:alkaline phosphatase D family protein [Planctomycetota bacterium]